MPCAYDYPDDCDIADIWSEKMVVARKEHACCECFQKIPKGTRHGVASYLSDGTWGTLRRCPECVVLADAVANVLKLCPLWGGLDDEIDNTDPEQGLMKLRDSLRQGAKLVGRGER